MNSGIEKIICWLLIVGLALLSPNGKIGAAQHDGPRARALGTPRSVQAEFSNRAAERAKSDILIGMEYALIKNKNQIKKLAKSFADIGAPAVKHYVEHIEWGEMQKRPNARINFSRLDNFVREFQAAGFTDLVVCLKSHSKWASVQHAKLKSTNPTPKPQFMAKYAKWVSAIVERYDHDGNKDMRGLKRPVRFYEIGSEFSSYEPEPPEDYLRMLEVAYEAAHAADPEARIAHAAFLTTTVFKDNPKPKDYEKAWKAAPDRILPHGLADNRKILDRPDVFDVVNFHALGDPYEIEQIVKWLKYEMKQRGYKKPMIISDTIPTSFIGWGPATVCNKKPNQMGIVIPPATEADRCRLADYFTRLLNGDQTVLRWTQGFVAKDVVQRVVVAAEQEVILINTAFMEDLYWQKLKVFKAGAGVSAWAGMVGKNVNERRPAFYALQQLAGHMNGYRSIKRLRLGRGVRVYELKRAGNKSWIAWLDPGRPILPRDNLPQKSVELRTGKPTLTIETTITQYGQTEPHKVSLQTKKGVARLTLSTTPIFVY
ncbi:MAG: hypothetical protein ACE5IY_19660 [bacterium]